MKLFATTILLFASVAAFGQIRFSDKTFDNGMRYPMAHFDPKPAIADSMNVTIMENLVSAEASDFCVGDYGYFQKGNHIELHLICNCIDFEETDRRYLFFNLESGKVVSYSDLFENKRKAEALKLINEKVRDTEAESTCTTEFGDLSEDLKWSEFTFRLFKDGFEVHPGSGECDSPVKIKWSEVTSLLKYNYL